MLKDERPGNPFGPQYIVESYSRLKTLRIGRNYEADKPVEGYELRYHVLLGNIGTAFSEEDMLEFFAAFLAVRDSYEA